MALAIDSQESGGVGHNSGTSPLTWTFNNVAGTLLIVGAVVGTDSAVPAHADITGVTYGGVAMIAVPSGSIFWFLTDHSKAQLWYLRASDGLPTGSNTVSVSFTIGTDSVNHDCIAGAISFTGSDPTTPFGTAASAKFDTGSGSTPATVNVTGTTSGNIVVAIIADGNAVPVPTAPSTNSWALGVSTHTAADNAALMKQAAGGTITMAATFSAADYWGIVAVEVLASGGGGGGTFVSIVGPGSNPGMCLAGQGGLAG